MKKRADGRLRTSFMYDNKRIYVYAYSKAELKQKEIQKRQELEAGKQAHDNPTMDEFYERFTDQRRASVKESTIRTQRTLYNLCKNVILPGTKKRFGEVGIQDITASDVKRVQFSLIQDGKHSKTINLTMAHLAHVFNTAIKSELIERDPTRVISSVKRTEPLARESIHRALTEKEIRAFFEAAKGNYYYNAFRLMILTGLRAGEMGALLPGDIDYKEKTMHVTKTITTGENGGAMIGDSTKTASSKRDIPLTDAAIEAIKSQMKVNNVIQFRSPDQPIFLSIEGHYLTPVLLNQNIEKICRVAGIEKFSCHSFRHSFATLFINQQPEGFKTLSAILGHSDTSITLNLYCHAMMDTKKKAMENLKIAL